MRITIPDEVAELYQSYAKTQGRSVEDVCTAQLTRFAKHEPGKRALILGAAAITTLEQTFGGLPLRTFEDIVARVKQLAAIEFHRVQLDFSPSQLAELQHRAARQGRTVDYLANEIIQAICRDFFWQSGGGAAKEPAVPAAPPGLKPVPNATLDSASA